MKDRNFNVHYESIFYPLRCVCGYYATSREDLDEHIVTATRGE